MEAPGRRRGRAWPWLSMRFFKTKLDNRLNLLYILNRQKEEKP